MTSESIEVKELRLRIANEPNLVVKAQLGKKLLHLKHGSVHVISSDEMHDKMQKAGDEASSRVIQGINND